MTSAGRSSTTSAVVDPKPSARRCSSSTVTRSTRSGAPRRSPPDCRGTLPARLFFSEADHNNRVEGEFVYDIKKMVRQGDSKFLLDTHSQAEELYDLKQDAGERQDLAAKDPARAAALRAELERYLESAVVSEAIPPPTEEEKKRLESLGYN